MKLKILPPTLRMKKRYIAINLYSQNKIAKKDILYLLSKSVVDLFGEIKASRINLWLISIKNIDDDKRFVYQCILQCQRGYEDDLKFALHTISQYNQTPVVVHTLKTSGSIKSLNKKINNN